MFAFHYQSSISLLSVLCVIVGASNATTAPSISTSELVQTVDTIKGNETSRVIVYGRTQDKVPVDLICECVSFYLCDSENAIFFPTSHHDNDQNQCQGEIEVCCAIRNETSSTPTSTLAINTFSSIQPNKANIITYGTTVDGASDLQCQCTLFYLCEEHDWITLPTDNQDQNSCPDSNVCCKIRAESGPVTEVDTWSSSPTEPTVITYESIDGYERRELRCYCILFYECLSANYVELPNTIKKEDQCAEEFVCCKEPPLLLK